MDSQLCTPALARSGLLVFMSVDITGPPVAVGLKGTVGGEPGAMDSAFTPPNSFLTASTAGLASPPEVGGALPPTSVPLTTVTS